MSWEYSSQSRAAHGDELQQVWPAGQLQATIPAGLPAGAYDLQACNSELCTTLVGGYATAVSGTDQVEVFGYVDSTYTIDFLAAPPSALKAGEQVNLAAAEKPALSANHHDPERAAEQHPHRIGANRSGAR